MVEADEYLDPDDFGGDDGQDSLTDEDVAELDATDNSCPPCGRCKSRANQWNCPFCDEYDCFEEIEDDEEP